MLPIVFRASATLALACLATVAVGQERDARPIWFAPGKGDIRIRLDYASTSPAPCVLLVGDAPAAAPLAKELAAKGMTVATLASATKHLLPAAHGLLQMHARELEIDAARMALVAVGGGAASAMDFVHEQKAQVVAFAMLDCVAPVVEGLRADMPTRVVTHGAETRTRAGQRELAHQLALAGAPVVWQTTENAVAEVERFCAARLLPPPANDAAVDAGTAWELARAAADRRDVAASLRWLDRAFAIDPSLVGSLAADQGFAAIRREDAFVRYGATRTPDGALQLTAPAEAGTAMHVHCRFVDAGGKPIAGAAIEVWQTDALGFYSHGRVTDEPRLRGHVRTDADGAFELHSVRPGGYPATMIPAHVHLRVGGREVELLFADDPRLSSAHAERMVHHGFGVVQLDAGGRGRAEFRLPAAR